jgi:TRAP-type C4-dicarboxylate transport system substrate-binding protein
MKTIIKAALAALALSASATTSLAQDFTMRLSHVFPPQHPLGKLASQYAEAVKMETGGKVAVEILGSGQAFAEREAYPAVAKGQVEATLLVSVQFSGIVPTIDALSIPFLVRGDNAAKAFLASDARKALDADIRTKRVEPLAWLFQTNTTVFTSQKAPLLKTDDFAGVKIRGLNKVADASLEALKASALSTPGSEVYQALQSGVLDAALTDVSAAFSRRYYEVQKFGTVVDNWVTAYGVLMVNPAWLQKIPADLRAGMARAASKVEAGGVAAGAANVAEAKAGLAGKGMALTVLNKEQESVWAAAMTAASRKAYLERNGAAGEAVLKAFDALAKTN